jgi:hypothetical protein
MGHNTMALWRPFILEISERLCHLHLESSDLFVRVVIIEIRGGQLDLTQDIQPRFHGLLLIIEEVVEDVVSCVP